MGVKHFEHRGPSATGRRDSHSIQIRPSPSSSPSSPHDGRSHPGSAIPPTPENLQQNGGFPLSVEAREIIAAFHGMVRTQAATELPAWLERAGESLVTSFANGVKRDEDAVRAAITSSWSNGQTEGQITKLKLVKRQMYGRGKIGLLQARLIGAA